MTSSTNASVSTPSTRHGMTAKEELAERRKGAKFIQAVCHQLRLPYNTAATACTYFHKFYTRRSFKVHGKFDIAAACLYLAAKSEETRKRVKDIMETCYYVQHKRKAPDPKSRHDEHEKLCNRILDK